MYAARLFFLGRPRFERDGQPAELTSSKAVGLLAYVALAPTSSPRDRLLALLWPDSAPEAARKNLRNALWTIRKSLGEVVLDAGDDRLSLSDTAWVDVHEFDAAASVSAAGQPQDVEAALEWYSGPFLEGLSLGDAPEFEGWQLAERERLGQVCLRLLGALLERYRAAGDWQRVISTAQCALALDDLQEPAYRALMEAHARLGQRAEALRQFDTLKTVLARELDVAPLAETEALRDRVAQGNLAAPAGVAARRFERPPVKHDASLPPFVGRRAELAVLDAEARAAASGQARVVLLTGEMGIGKSRLWGQWSAALPPEAVVLECRCVEATQSLPFAPLTDLFRSRAGSGLFASASPVPAIWLAEMARLLPEIRLARPDLPPPVKLPPDEERRRVFEAFSQCLLSLPARPLVLFVDDLHWADRATLDWLGYLTHRARDQSLLLVAAYRPEDAPAALVTLAAEWGRGGRLQRLPLARLTPDESAQLVGGLAEMTLLDAASVQRAQARGEGNPYFTIELCRAAPGDVPSALTELVRARLERLPQAALQVLQAAAVLEPEFGFELLRHVSGRHEAETLDALDALLGAAVLVERGAAYSFSHPLLASVVRDDLSGARRAFLYRRAAQALEIEYAGRLSLVAGRLAGYYAGAGLAGRAAAYAEAAAQHALDLALPAQAVDFFRQACALETTPGREAGLGYALHQAGESRQARTVLASAIRGLEAAGDRRGVARALVNLQDANLRAGHVDEIVAWEEQGLTDLLAEADPQTRAMAHFILGAAFIHSRRPLAEAERHLNLAGRLAAEYGLADIAARGRFALGNLRAEQGELAGAAQAFEEAARMAKAVGDPFHQIVGHNNASYHAILLGDLAAARHHVQIGLALAEELALPITHQWLFSTSGEIALAEQKWEEAETWFTRGLAEAERYGNPEMAAGCRANLGLAARGRGDLDQALVLLEEARQMAPALQLKTQIDLWLADLYLQRGERAAAREALARAEAQLGDERRERLRIQAIHLHTLLSPNTGSDEAAGR